MPLRVCKLVCAKQRCCEGAANLPLWRGTIIYGCAQAQSVSEASMKQGCINLEMVGACKGCIC